MKMNTANPHSFQLKITLRLRKIVVYFHNLFEYFIPYQCHIKISIIFLSINGIHFSCPPRFKIKSSNEQQPRTKTNNAS